MRIFITGDTHRDIDINKITTKKWPLQKALTKDDILFITGDFGLPWSEHESKIDKYWLKWHDNKNYTTVFIDGNHENFNSYKNYPIVSFYGAKCHQIRDSIYHVIRGEIMTINDKSILFMGGAESTDKIYRKPNISWWKEEIPTDAEFQKFHNQISKEPDIIITHDAPSSIVNMIPNMQYNEPSVVAKEFQRALFSIHMNNQNEPYWFFGHYHIDEIFNNNFYAVFNNIYEIKIDKDIEIINSRK